MMTFENTVHISRPVEEVFRFVADFENVPRWNYYVLQVRQLAGDGPGVGAAYHQVRKSDEQTYRVVEYQANRSVTVRTTPDSTPWFEMRFTFQPVEGGTRLVDAWKLKTGHNPLLEKLAAFRVKAAVAENLGKLKELLESGQTRLQDGRLVRL